MKAKNIGKMQLIIGIAFLILIVIISVFIVKYAFIDNLVLSGNRISDYLQTFKEANPDINMTASGYNFHFVSYLVILKTNWIIAGALFAMCLLIAVMLSLILILQGLKLTKK